jgi:ankyrin repeat protein
LLGNPNCGGNVVFLSGSSPAPGCPIQHGCVLISNLHVAAYDGNIAVIELLLDRGAEVNAKNDRGETPRSIAADKGHTDAVVIFKFHGGV